MKLFGSYHDYKSEISHFISGHNSLISTFQANHNLRQHSFQRFTRVKKKKKFQKAPSFIKLPDIGIIKYITDSKR